MNAAKILFIYSMLVLFSSYILFNRMLFSFLCEHVRDECTCIAWIAPFSQKSFYNQLNSDTYTDRRFSLEFLRKFALF